MRRILSALALTAAAAMVMVPTAANAAEVRAPYARAAAAVDSTGVLLHEKNIVSVSKAALGRYCVTVDPSVDVTQAIITVSESDYRISQEDPNPTPTCGSATNTVTVRLADRLGNYADGDFTLVVH